MKFRGRILSYIVLAACIGLGAILLLSLSPSAKLAEANPYDFATFLIVISGAGVALVAQEFAGRLQIAGFRRTWVENLRAKISQLAGLLDEFDHAATQEKLNLRIRIYPLATEVMLMLTDLRANRDATNLHAVTEAAIQDALKKRSINLDSPLIIACRPLLKEGWKQAVEEVR